MSQERLVYVCDFVPPAINAVGQYVLGEADSAARAGHSVTVIGLGDPSGAVEERRYRAGALRVVRLEAAEAPKASMLRRAAWTLRTNMRLVRALGRQLRTGAGDTRIVVTGSPPFLSYAILLLNRLFWRRPVTYRIMDMYPEVLFAAGKARWLRALQPFVVRLRRLADRLEALGEDQKKRLIESGIPESKISIARLGAPCDMQQDATPLPSPFAPDEIALLYSGNMGVAHDPSTFLEAYRRHVQEGSNRVRLWLSGSGARQAEVRAYCAAHHLPVHVTPGVPLSELPALLRAPHAHLVLLGAPFWGFVHPSKIYACLEAGQPVLFFGPAQADIARLIAGRDGSRAVAPGDSAAGFAALEALAAQHAQAA